MTEARDAAGHVQIEAPLVGDHLALDLLNTEARSQGGLIDHWATAADVVRWLARHGIGQAAGTPPPSGLLAQGRTLRARVRALVVARKAGDHPDLAVLNEFLHRYVTAPSVKRTSDGGFALARTACSDAVPALLGPVAEAAAQLLVEGDFALVRQCEHPDCILWFYDRTKSHKRRWCSMAQCGNRQKAATFRARSARGPRASA